MLEDKMHADLVERQQIQKKDSQIKSAYQFFYDRRHFRIFNLGKPSE